MSTPNELARFDSPQHTPAVPTTPVGGLALPPAFGFSALPSEQPSVLWTVLTRHLKLLLAVAVIGLAAAYYVGQMYGKPTWQAEGALIYQAIPLTDAQAKVYTRPPEIGSLALWLSDRELVGQVLAEFAPGASVDDFLAKNLKVSQPTNTQWITVSVTWSDREAATKIANRIMELAADRVAEVRKDTMLRLARQAAQQDRASAQDDERFWSERTRQIQANVRNGIPTLDTDQSALTYRMHLNDQLRTERGDLSRLEAELRPKEVEFEGLRKLAKQQVISAVEFSRAESDLRQLRIKISATREQIKAHEDDLTTFPIKVAEAERSRHALAVQRSGENVRKLEQLAGSAINGRLPARGFLEGMDARELVVKAEARTGDKPYSSSKKQVAAIAFMLLMAVAFGLLLAYDRYAHPPAPSAGPPQSNELPPAPVRASVVRVARRDGNTEEVTIARVESDRLDVRIDQWLKPPESNGGTPLTLDAEGKVLDRPPGSGDDPAHLALRIQQWLEKY